MPPVQENGVSVITHNNNFLPGSTPGNAAPDEHVRDNSDAVKYSPMPQELGGQNVDDAESELDDEVIGDDRERLVLDNFQDHPKEADERIEGFDRNTPNYHQRNGRRTSQRREVSQNVYATRAYKMSLKKAINSRLPGVEQAILNELQQLINKSVWLYQDKRMLNKEQRRKLIRSHMFMKDKYSPAGEFLKWKARLVAGGDTQDKSIYDDLSSPTVSLDSVFAIIAIAALENRKLATVDITGAYLECVLPPEDEVFMVLDATIVAILNKLDPKANQYKTDTGEVVVKLKRALYGCVQSALLWFKKLKTTLGEAGFIANPYDQCVFNKILSGKQVTIAFHVDDLLITSESQRTIDEVISFLKSKFSAVTAERGDKHSYLAMTIDITNSHYTVSMDGYIQSLLKDRRVKYVQSPATDSLFEEDGDNNPLPEGDKKIFHSEVAKVLFLAKRVGMSCLIAIGALASKVSAPTVEDRKKLDRVFNYLSSNNNMTLKFKRNGVVTFEAFVDASHATQQGRKSRTGILLKMAGCAIGAWSTKQKIVTKSSTEAELVALTESLTNIIWLRRFLEYQGYNKLPPIKVWEDNKSCIDLITKSRNGKQRTRHLDIRYFYAKELIDNGLIDVKYVQTSDQEADLLTKGMTGENFSILVKKLMGHI